MTIQRYFHTETASETAAPGMLFCTVLLCSSLNTATYPRICWALQSFHTLISGIPKSLSVQKGCFSGKRRNPHRRKGSTFTESSIGCVTGSNHQLTLSWWEGRAGLMDAGYKAEQKHKRQVGLQKQVQIKSRLYKEDAVLCIKIQS